MGDSDSSRYDGSCASIIEVGARTTIKARIATTGIGLHGESESAIHVPPPTAEESTRVATHDMIAKTRTTMPLLRHSPRPSCPAVR